jgi:hypothetical protein
MELFDDESSFLLEARRAAWLGRLKRAYIAAFILVWLVSMAAFCSFGIVYRSGAKLPTATQTVPLANHGRIVYVTPSRKHLVNFFLTAMLIGIPSVMIAGLVLDRVVGVPCSARGAGRRPGRGGRHWRI